MDQDEDNSSMPNSYTSLQTVRDAQYRAAWSNAPKEFLDVAGKAGLKPHIENPGSAMEFDENRQETSLDFSYDSLDGETMLDGLVEKFGCKNEKLIQEIFNEVKRLIEIEHEKNIGLAIGRILFYLVKSERKNIRASLYSALHSIPRLAAANGIYSMRESARICGVSPEWIRRSRDEICGILQIPVPCEARKSLDARKKYSQNGNSNHWRSQTTKKGKKICKKEKTSNCSSLLETVRRSALQKKETSLSVRISPTRNGERA